MAYNFLDPAQQEEFRQKAVASGVGETEINSYIANRRKQQESSVYGVNSEGKPNIPDKADNKLSESQQKFKTALTASKDALSYLQGGLNTGPVASTLGKVGEVFGRSSSGTEYRSALALANTALKSAFLGGAQSSGELKGIKDLIPKATDQENVAKQKLEKMIQLIQEQFPEEKINTPQQALTAVSGQKMITSPSDVISQSQPILKPSDMLEPEISVAGTLAKPGDLVRSENGSLKIHGDSENAILKRDTELGFTVDNALIRYLADSSFLPIAGSVAGTVSGGILGGAAGASGGKALQQALSELVNPDKQDLSSATRAVLTEGVIDAALSGLTLGIGKVAGKALGIVLTKPGSEAAKLVTESAEEATKVAGKEAEIPLAGARAQMLRKAYNIGTTKGSEYLQKYGSDYYDDLIKMTGGKLDELTSPEAAFNFAKSGQQATEKELEAGIAGRAVKADQIIPDLKKLVTGLEQPISGGKTVIPDEFSSGVKRLNQRISILEGYAEKNGGYIPLDEVQKTKVAFNDAFAGQTTTEASSKAFLQKARGELMRKIEEYGGEGIKDSNKKWYIYDLLKDASANADQKVVKQAIDAVDQLGFLGTAATGSPVAIGGSAVVSLLRKFSKEPLKQLWVANKLAQYSIEANSKTSLRTLLRATQSLGIPMGIDQALIKQAARVPGLVPQQDQGLQTPQDLIAP